ncbi:hypothetical protein [Methanobacterium paludis]|uniref:Uncharacterized protein n=1 Tax=Methanobacterium paludis (strain DSM 25820 / JCM 18151 / SWAN1) TaxID=868131 RepID=F6D4Y3_METPW|nr:hypothetical protein [Methanobacterium paludis]AEG19262.1 hypothetical protein MSWAN_2255 [Methanobacterium paludis]
MITVPRTWLSLEDQIRPTQGRKVHLIVDVLTNENVLKIPFPMEKRVKILKLVINGVNLGRELTYTEDKNSFLIDLGDLENWTSTKNSSGLTHAKLDFNFITTDPNVKLSHMDLGYETFIEVDGYKLDGGSFTLPRGLEISKGHVEIETFLKCGKIEKKFKQTVKSDYVEVNEKRRSYKFLVKTEFKDIVNYEKCEIKFRVSYRVVNERKYFIIPLVSFALLIVAITRFNALLSGSGEFNIEYLAAAVAILGITLNFMNEGYELPLRKLIFISVLLLIVEVSLELILLPYGN